MEEPSEFGQRLVHASCGAFLAALVGMGAQFWHQDINWWVVGIFAIFGFILAWFVGEEAIEFLKNLWWWS